MRNASYFINFIIRNESIIREGVCIIQSSFKLWECMQKYALYCNCLWLKIFTSFFIHCRKVSISKRFIYYIKKKLHKEQRIQILRMHFSTIYIKLCIIYNHFYNKKQFVAVLICMGSDDCGSHRIPSTSSSIKRQIYTHMSKHDSHDPTLYSSRIRKLRDSNFINLFL